MTDTPPADRPVDEPQKTPPEFDADEVKTSDPTLSSVGDTIDDAKSSAREIFGDKESDADDEQDADEDLGGSAPVP
jgi:hypothetical protein